MEEDNLIKVEKVKEVKRVSIFLGTMATIFSLGVGILVGTVIGKKSTDIDENLKKFLEMYELIYEDSLYTVDKEDLINGAINGMLSVLNDPYTFYTLNSGEQNLGTNGYGLGITRTPYNGNCLITQVMENSPAAKAGLKENDIIYKIAFIDNNRDIVDTRILNEVSYTEWNTKIFTYEDGTELKIYFYRNEEGILKEYETYLTVTTFQSNNVTFSSELTEDGKVEAYIKIHSFLGSGYGEISPVDELNGALNTIINKYSKIDHLIFDVRENGGGYVSNFVNCMAYFVEQNTTVMRYRYRDGSIQNVTTKDWSAIKKYSANKYTVIVNENSASAAESFAMAAKDLLDATIVGQVSYGKGIAQGLKYYDDGSVLRYTFAEVLPPISESIHMVGIQPDIEVGYKKEDKLIYRGYVEGVENNDELELELKNLVLKQINLVMNEKYNSFNEAIRSFKDKYDLGGNDTFDRVTANYLQMKVYDVYQDISMEILNTAKGV